MEKIPSFTVNHLDLQRGIYVSRQDQVGTETVTTFDIRLKRPNLEPVLGNPEIHTIEHIAATYLRNHQRADDVIYFGPMGCRTGFYLILKGDLTAKDAAPLITEAFQFVSTFEGPVPGATARDCGNYLDINLDMAKYEAARYLENTLSQLTEANLNYPA